jgi:hypothetical protein
LKVAQVALQTKPQNTTIKESMEEATLKGLKVFEEGKIDDIRIGSRIKWFKKGHVAIKESFVLLKD